MAVGAARTCWNMLPGSVLSTRGFQKLGKLIHRSHIKWQGRAQSHRTWFVRNVPLLELLRDIVLKVPAQESWRVFSVGCSTGAELYSLLWYLRSARPDLQISATGADIGDWAIAQASGGKYSLEDGEVARLSKHVRDALFDQLDGVLKVKDWIRNDIRWTVVDALDPKLLDQLGSADLLLANNFLGAMSDEKAEQCMENLLRLVSPGGYFVFNGDLDLKSRFAKKHCLVPVSGRIEAVHFGDTGRLGWPWSYWASEPIDKGRSDWEMRYSVVFARPFRPVEEHLEVDAPMGRPASERNAAVEQSRRLTARAGR